MRSARQVDQPRQRADHSPDNDRLSQVLSAWPTALDCRAARCPVSQFVAAKTHCPSQSVMWDLVFAPHRWIGEPVIGEMKSSCRLARIDHGSIRGCLMVCHEEAVPGQRNGDEWSDQGAAVCHGTLSGVVLSDRSSGLAPRHDGDHRVADAGSSGMAP